MDGRNKNAGANRPVVGRTVGLASALLGRVLARARARASRGSRRFRSPAMPPGIKPMAVPRDPGSATRKAWDAEVPPHLADSLTFSWKLRSGMPSFKSAEVVKVRSVSSKEPSSRTLWANQFFAISAKPLQPLDAAALPTARCRIVMNERIQGGEINRGPCDCLYTNSWSTVPVCPGNMLS